MNFGVYLSYAHSDSVIGFLFYSIIHAILTPLYMLGGLLGFLVGDIFASSGAVGGYFSLLSLF